MSAVADISTTLAQIEAARGIDRLRELSSSFAQADAATVKAVLSEAARFCATHLAPLNAVADRQGCRVEGGRVKTPEGHIAAWQAYVDAGWSTLDHPVDLGGQGLPLFLSASVQELVDRSCAAFGMLPVLQRSAARLLAAHGDDQLRRAWLPRLISGEWGTSICISEAGAGSDVGRLRTVARARPDGTWAITGEKMWVSFGDHDLTPRIGHCLLARTDKGLSLFLVPSHLPDEAGDDVRNAVVVRRLEEKLGLHGSPTCALGFEAATAWLIGTEGRGLQQLFVMITNMRLSAGVQGLGIAVGAADIAFAYAQDRRQGGPPDRPPVPIVEHIDIQRELIEMVARVETLRGLGIAIAVHADLAAVETDLQLREEHSALVQWLLPIFKTTGGEWGFDVASAAIQVLGGAGYTREWPVEQMLRDARIATIYEGTSGIQALDLLHRRLWRDRAKGLDVFLAMARADLASCPEAGRAQAERCYDLVESAARHLQAATASVCDAEAGATAFLHLAALAATGWIATRLAALSNGAAASRRLAAAGNYWLCNLADRAQPLHAEATRGAAPINYFHDL